MHEPPILKHSESMTTSSISLLAYRVCVFLFLLIGVLSLAHIAGAVRSKPILGSSIEVSGVYFPNEISLREDSRVTTRPSRELRWEYKKIDQRSSHEVGGQRIARNDADSELKQAGLEGWELVAYERVSFEKDTFTYFLKRPMK